MINFELFITFFLIGLFSFGGGAAMMALIEQEVVVNHMWMTSSELYRFFGIAESTPGPIAVNIATAIGFEQNGVLGSLCATLGVILPSFIIILIISMLFKKFAKNKYFKIILDGIKPVIIGLILAMIIKITCINIFGGFGYLEQFNFDFKPFIITIILVVVYFISIKLLKKKMPPILLICLSIIVGILIYS